jgi:hypothetical protein
MKRGFDLTRHFANAPKAVRLKKALFANHSKKL